MIFFLCTYEKEFPLICFERLLCAEFDEEEEEVKKKKKKMGASDAWRRRLADTPAPGGVPLHNQG
jgi:hypothetical protein